MKTLGALVKRNFRMFFKDKGAFFTALITPAILLVLYVTFLGKVYRDAFTAHFPEWLSIPEELVNGLVGGQLISSLRAVSCVTVAFCANMLMVSDKASGARNDLIVTPV
ncbi:MAG: ABC transporter permease, partial [Clostridia bacterium]|nr:ABC transporter permease [Clostridia bacterium]